MKMLAPSVWLNGHPQSHIERLHCDARRLAYWTFGTIVDDNKPSWSGYPAHHVVKP